MKFEFASAKRIIFGPGKVSEVAPLAAGMGKRACVVTGRSTERAQTLLKQLEEYKINYVIFNVTGEPTTETVKKAVELARKNHSDTVTSLGGGSVIDTGKAVAAMLTNNGELEDYLEVVGLGKPISRPTASHIAIPTTAGTGAEVTRNAVLGVSKHKVKVSIRSPLMLPSLAVIDPILTHSMSPEITASTGLDALTQLLEVYISNKANPLTDGICREGLIRVGRSLRRAFENGGDAPAREDMAVASLFSGLGLANAGLGAVHGFAGPLGSMIPAGHGAICAGLLPFVMEANMRALQNRQPDSAALCRYNEIAQILTGNKKAMAENGTKWVHELCSALKVKPLSQLGLTEQNFSAIVAKARKSSSMKGNPIELTDEELMEILKKAT